MIISPAPGANEETDDGRVAYEAFALAMAPWIPQAPAWEALSEHVKNGWIAGAKAVRAKISKP
jgi:hypothetical protein